MVMVPPRSLLLALAPFCLALVGGAMVGPADARQPEAAPTLTSAGEVRALTPVQAASQNPVRIEGVVTFFDAEKNLAFIQDDTGAVYFTSQGRGENGSRVKLALRSGIRIQLQGVSEPGSYSPIVAGILGRLPEVNRRGRAALPEPIRLERGYLLSPALDCMWVQLTGTVLEETLEGDRRTLAMQAGGQRFLAVFEGPAEAVVLPPDLTGAEVRLRGVYGSVVDPQGRLTGLRLYVPGAEFITVLDRGEMTAFDQPPVSVRDLLRFRPDSNSRVRVDGLVTAAFPDGRLFLHIEAQGLLVRTKGPPNVQPGDFVQAAGFPMLEAGRVVLEEALLRVERQGAPPEPLFVRMERLVEDPALADQLVEVDALLTDGFEEQAQLLMRLEEEGHQLLAVLDLGADPNLARVPLKSWVRVSGICVLNAPDAQGQPTRARLLLRSPADLTVLREPSFWTVRRVMMLAGVLVAGLLAGIIWVWVLNRRLENQTLVIAEKVERERIGEERTRIARELHDTLEQELAGIGMQLDLASSRMRTNPERARQPLDLALQMLRKSQAEARRSIMNLRSGLLEQQNLADAIREMITLSQKPDRPTISLAVEGTPRKLATRTEHNLLRICQEAINNVNKHAREATQIRIALAFTDTRIRLTIEDDGPGFQVAPPRSIAPETGGRKSFGLLGMRERANKIGGTLIVDSRPGAGTRILIDAVASEPGSDHHEDPFSPHSTPPPS